jgi:hypothetical protein
MLVAANRALVLLLPTAIKCLFYQLSLFNSA